MNETDGRSLGVAVGHIRFDGEPAALDDPRLGAGWHAPEAGWRWTAGDAAFHIKGVRDIRFDLIMTGSYWLQPAGGSEEARHVRY